MTIFQHIAAALERSRAYRVLLLLWGRLPLPNPLRWLILWLGVQKFLVGISAVVLNERGEVLLFRHTYRPKCPWGLPGGWLKRGEDPARAVEREIREESGMEVKILRPLISSQRTDYAQIEITYLARWVRGAFRPSAEVAEGCFFTRETLPPIYPEVREVIEMAWREVTVNE